MPNTVLQRKVVEAIDRLAETHTLSDADASLLLTALDADTRSYLHKKAREQVQDVYGNRIFVRGLIEISNHCVQNCLYCGIRRDNREVERYRLTPDEILECAEAGYALGFRTFVLQGGEDPYYTDERMVPLLRTIKERHPDCAVTLSLGVRSGESYRRLREAGADRYLLRHETANATLFSRLHPAEQSLADRLEALQAIHELGYATGTGFMVGAPGQAEEDLLDDLRLLQSLDPDMIGIGPFLPHNATQFAQHPAGDWQRTADLIAILRLLFPEALIPATTALASANPDGRATGILAGANVIMPNLSPASVRAAYSLYDNKLATGTEAAEHLLELKAQMKRIGYEIVTDRGDRVRRSNES